MKNTYILVHGAWHGAWAWDKLRPHLEAEGHRVITPDMPGHGEDKSPIENQNLEAYARAVEGILRTQETPVILVGHSMGGMIISQAACYVPEKVGELVYISAFLPKDGQSCDGIDHGIKPTDWVKLAEQGEMVTLTNGGKCTRLLEDFALKWLYNDMPEADAVRFVKLLRPEAIAAQHQPVKLSDAFYKIPKTYVRCLRDMSIPADIQDRMIADGRCGEVYSMDCGHNPFVSDPEGLAKILLSRPE